MFSNWNFLSAFPNICMYSSSSSWAPQSLQVAAILEEICQSKESAQFYYKKLLSFDILINITLGH